MGGHAFFCAEPIALDKFQSEWKNIQQILSKAGCSYITLIGSSATNIKPIMGDIDVVCKHKDKKQLHNKLKRLFPMNIRLIGGNTISFVYKSMQIDVSVVDNIKFVSWARTGTQNIDKSRNDYSLYKGTLRQVFFNALLKQLSTKIFIGNDCNRECYSLDLDKGLFISKQTIISAKTGMRLSKWKTTERLFLTDDVQQIINVLYNCTNIQTDILTFESAYKQFVDCESFDSNFKFFIFILV
jgi:predicted nucleotidyltransferase